MQKIWPFSLNFVFFAGVAFVMPFTVLYYQSLGLSGAEIGLLVGLTPLITLFGAPLWTGLADATQQHRLLMSIAMLVGTVAIFLVPFFEQVALVVALIILFSIFFAPVASFMDSATMFMLAGQKEMYGRIRVGGTLGFGLAALVAGSVVENYGLKFAFWGGGILYFLGFIVSLKLVYRRPRGLESVAAPREGIRILLTNPRWILFLTLAFAGSLALAATNSYLLSYMKELGASGQMMGYALTLGTLSEIPLLFFGNRLLKKFKAHGLLTFATVITGIRLLALAAFNTPEFVLVTQFFGGFTFVAMWMAGVSYADESAPPGMSATAQGLFGAVVLGFGLAVGGLLGGLLLDNLGLREMYFIIGVIILVTAAIVALIESRMPMEQKIVPNDI